MAPREAEANRRAARAVDVAPNDGLQGPPLTCPADATSCRVLFLHAGSDRRDDFDGALTAALAVRPASRLRALRLAMTRFDLLQDQTASPGAGLTPSEQMIADVRRGAYDLVLVAPPASEHSRVRFANRLGPPPLRNAAFPWGFPWLEGLRAAKVERQNEALRCVIRVLQATAAARVESRPNGSFRPCRAWMVFPEDLGSHRLGDPASPWQLPEIRALTECGFATGAAFTCELAGTAHMRPLRFLTNGARFQRRLYPGWPIFRAHPSRGCAPVVRKYAGPLPPKCSHGGHAPLNRASSAEGFRTRAALAVPPQLCELVALDFLEEILGAGTNDCTTPEDGGLVRVQSGSDLPPLGWSERIPTAELDTLVSQLQAVEWPAAPRGAVADAAGGPAAGGLLGLSRDATITEISSRAAGVIRAISNCIKALPALDQFSWTSCQINCNTRAAPHCDAELSGRALMIAAGTFTGGRFRANGSDWMDVAGRATMFKGAQPHESEPFQGERWSGVLFIQAASGQMTPEVFDQLRGWGFRPPAGPAALQQPPSDERVTAEAGRRRSAVAQGAESDTEPDVEAAPAGAGWRGTGPPMVGGAGYKSRPFQDGLGLCSPGRWPPERRRLPSGAPEALRGLIQRELSLLGRQSRYSADEVFRRLIAGATQENPSPREATERIWAGLRDALCRENFPPVSHASDLKQPVEIRLLEAFAKACADPAAHLLDRYASGVRYGVGVRLPRLPAVWRRKRRWRLEEQRRDTADFPEDPLGELYRGAVRENYKSAKELKEALRTELEQMVEDGKTLKMTLGQARKRWGSRLTVASQGALIKQWRDDGSPEVRVLFDGTHGLGLNTAVKQRDHIDLPGPPDLAKVLRTGGGIRTAHVCAHSGCQVSASIGCHPPPGLAAASVRGRRSKGWRRGGRNLRAYVWHVRHHQYFILVGLPRGVNGPRHVLRGGSARVAVGVALRGRFSFRLAGRAFPRAHPHMPLAPGGVRGPGLLAEMRRGLHGPVDWPGIGLPAVRSGNLPKASRLGRRLDD